MNKTKSLVVIALFGTIISFAILFRSFLVENIISPLAFVFWLIVRIFLSVDQRVYWGGLILVTILYAMRNLTLEPESEAWNAGPDTNATLERIKNWRTLIAISADAVSDQDLTLKRNLIELLIATYANKQQESVFFEVEEALRQKQIALPQPIFDFLFAPEPTHPQKKLLRIWEYIRSAPRRWVHKWTGREAAEYYQSIEDVFSFMENSLEINDDDRTPDH